MKGTGGLEGGWGAKGRGDGAGGRTGRGASGGGATMPMIPYEVSRLLGAARSATV